MSDFDEPDRDPQMHAYRTMSPRQYAHTARLVDICMTISDRRCAGGECDEDRACRRHRNAPRVADRLRQLTERWARL
jgi:hypothetical protein